MQPKLFIWRWLSFPFFLQNRGEPCVFANPMMRRINVAKSKHLTDEERLQIENWLKGRISLKQIAYWLNKSPSTISREIRAHAIPSDKSAPYRPPNRCAMRSECKKLHLCEGKPDCTRRCSTCKLCNMLCDDFVEQTCYRLFSSPYCCNGCDEEHTCTLRRRYYIHKKAHEAYREMLVESRSGANISESELQALDRFISPLICKGQSVHHIVTNNPDEFNVSEKTIYRYVDGGLLTARNIDMPRVVRIRPRKTKAVEHKVDKTCRIGRTYPEFLQFIEQSGVSFVEMDSVLGRVGGKVLLTLTFTNCDFMLAFIRDRNTSQSVIDCFEWMDKVLGQDYFQTLFPVLLGDNGSEFSNPKALEFDADGNRRTKVFFCDPNASYQKPKVEWSHTMLRRILPKGTSFDHLDQDDINLAMSHVNSYSRESLNDKPPIDLFALIYGQSIYEKLGLRKIPPNEITLKPELLKKRDLPKERDIDLAVAIPATEPAALPLKLTADQLYDKYADAIAEKAAQYAVSSGTLYRTDEESARWATDQIVSRVVSDLLLESAGYYDLSTGYYLSPDFKVRLEDHVFRVAYLEQRGSA